MFTKCKHRKREKRRLRYPCYGLSKNTYRKNRDFNYLIFFALAVSVLAFSILFFGIKRFHGSQSCSPVYVSDIGEISFLVLDESSWANMNTEQRLDALQRVANCEMDAIGIEATRVISEDLKNSDSTYTIGCYRPSAHEIVIDSYCLAQFSYARILENLLHECRHAYQYSVISILNWDCLIVQRHQYFEDARRWKAGFMQRETDFHTYYLQSIESDARSYAKDRLELYLGINEG